MLFNIAILNVTWVGDCKGLGDGPRGEVNAWFWERSLWLGVTVGGVIGVITLKSMLEMWRQVIMEGFQIGVFI